MRGEEASPHVDTRVIRELPPHARRRAPGFTSGGRLKGITSACAEKRQDIQGREREIGNYLRMRGEEQRLLGAQPPMPELPPHARRRGV